MSRPRGDAHWMRRALRLARHRAGRTWPNPPVGACLVRDGRLLGEGAHARAGEAHAEVLALEDARARGHDPRGATVYVTLEPCHHEGRTPPCSRALFAAGVARVVYATDDDSSRQHGGGARWLVEQGIRVGTAGPRAVARELVHPFLETRDDHEVHVTLKLALDAEGRMARVAGPVADPAARRVTGERAERRVHRMRAGASAVLVGRRTAHWDRPRLDVRRIGPAEWAGPGPRPVVLDPRAVLRAEDLPPGALVFHGRDAATPSASEGRQWVALPLRGDGRLPWDAVLGALSDRGLGILLVEGGAAIAADLVAEARPHRIHLHLSPRLLGGDGPRFDLRSLSARYRPWRERRMGEDLERVLRRDDLPRAGG